MIAFAVVCGAATVDGHRSLTAAAVIGAWVVPLTAIASIDARTRRIPNAIVYPLVGATLTVAAIDPARSLAGTLAGATFAASPFLVAFFVIPRRSFGSRGQRRPRSDGGEGHVRWAGMVGATTMLLVGLAQAEQSSVGAITAATVAGVAFLPLFFSRRSGVGRTRRRPPGNMGGGMGGGDVKLAILLGAIAGVPAVFGALFVAVLGGAGAAAMLLVLRRGAPGSAIPYGPFLAAGGVLALLSGSS